jgi:hypothetical protein
LSVAHPNFKFSKATLYFGQETMEFTLYSSSDPANHGVNLPAYGHNDVEYVPEHEHLPSSDPDDEEYMFRHHRGPAWATTVGRRRARTLIACAQDVDDELESNRHIMSALRERKVAKKPYITLTAYDDAMSHILWYGRPSSQLGEPMASECHRKHKCRGCRSGFYCGFVGFNMGCPFKAVSWAYHNNRSWAQKMHRCNQCLAWVDQLRDYKPPTPETVAQNRTAGLGPFLIPGMDVENVSQRFLEIQDRQADHMAASLVLLRVTNWRRVQEDRAYYKRRANNLHAAGLPWPPFNYWTRPNNLLPPETSTTIITFTPHFRGVRPPPPGWPTTPHSPLTAI